jgi:hypothetical protein
MSSLQLVILVLVAGIMLMIVYKLFPMNDLLRVMRKGITVLFVLLWLFSMGWLMYSLTIAELFKNSY